MDLNFVRELVIFKPVDPVDAISRLPKGRMIVGLIGGGVTVCASEPQNLIVNIF